MTLFDVRFYANLEFAYFIWRALRTVYTLDWRGTFTCVLISLL